MRPGTSTRPPRAVPGRSPRVRRTTPSRRRSRSRRAERPSTGSNVNATKEAGEPNHAGVSGGHSVWYTWTPAKSTAVTIDTAGSAYDTTLAVYTGSSVSALAKVAANDDASSSLRTSRVRFSATGGRVYRIAVDGYSSATGALTLNLKLG